MHLLYFTFLYPIIAASCAVVPSKCLLVCRVQLVYSDSINAVAERQLYSHDRYELHRDLDIKQLLEMGGSWK